MKTVKTEENLYTISTPVWVKGGIGMVRADCLPSDHPSSTYQFIKAKGLKPEDYGVYTDRAKLIRRELEHLSNEELMNKCADLMIEIESRMKAGF